MHHSSYAKSSFHALLVRRGLGAFVVRAANENGAGATSNELSATLD
jgi:hypothetical protein